MPFFDKNGKPLPLKQQIKLYRKVYGITAAEAREILAIETGLSTGDVDTTGIPPNPKPTLREP